MTGINPNGSAGKGQQGRAGNSSFKKFYFVDVGRKEVQPDDSFPHVLHQ